MAIDMFDTRTMIEMLAAMKPARTFLKETFFGGDPVTFDTEYVDIDIIKGKRRMAPFVSPNVGSKTIERQGYQTNTYKPVLVAPDTITTAQDLLKRAPGEYVYGTMSPDERAAQQLGRDMAELDNLITRREEWMCAQALFNGQIHMVGEGVDETVDFGLTHNEVLAAGSRWNEDTSDPLANLRAWRRAIIQDSGVSPDTVVMGSDAIDAFISHAKVKDALDNRRVDLGQINPQALPNGVTYYGFIRDVGVDIYGYDEWYLDDAGQEQPMVPTKKVLMGSKNARTDFLYGAVVDAARGTFALPRVPKSWVQEKPSARFIQIASRPMPVPVQIDAFYVAQVVA